MAKFFIMYASEFLLFITLLTQVVIPIFIPKLKFFWLFRSEAKSEVTDLSDLNKEADEVKLRKDSLKEKVSSAEEAINQIKDKTK